MSLDEENQVRELINQGNRFLAARRYEEALDNYKDALEIDPDNRIAKGNIALVHNNWGTDLFNQRKFFEAKKQWQKAVEINPNDSIARRNLQVLEVHIRNHKRRALKEALQAQKAQEEEINENEEQEENQTQNQEPDKAKAKKSETRKQSAVLILNSGESNPEQEKTFQKESSSVSEQSPKQEAPSNIKIISPTKEPSTSVDTILENSLNTLKSSYEEKNKQPDSTKNDTTDSSPDFETVVEEEESNGKVEKKEKENKVVKKSESEPKSAREEKSEKLTIKEQIRRLELKVFGEKRDSMPIIKRLIQLEKDTLGKKQSGAVNKRIQNLNEIYGF